MTRIMTPSKPMTTGQIDKAVANYRALLEKNSEYFNADAVQMALGQSELARVQFAVFRSFVEAFSNLIVRTAKVNRSRSQQEAIEATGRAQYTDRNVVDVMPKGDGDEVEVVFFKPDLSNRNGYISDDDLEKEFDLRGLKPADPISVAAVNEADSAFADEKPNGTYWKDFKGNWCCAVFRRRDGRRRADVHRYVGGWRGSWWLAGVRK